jgi:RimJ/RimL family protein N-acetyltransferase
MKGEGPMRVPPLETARLLIREFVHGDLESVHQLLDSELAQSSTRKDRERWLSWTCLGYDELARLHQPPYGDRALALKGTGQLIGLCGYVPCLDAFAQLAALRHAPAPAPPGLFSAEVGLHWAVAPAHRRCGYATEAARALIDYGFDQLALWRLVATTERTNQASIGVMRKLGMAIGRNPYPEPAWLQVVGIIYHPRWRTAPI